MNTKTVGSRSLLILVFVTLVCACCLNGPAHAGTAGLVENAVKYIMRAFGDDVARIGGRQVLEEAVAKAVARHGEDAAQFLAKTGPRGLEVLEKTDGAVLAWFREAGEDVARVVARPGFETEVMPLVLRHGKQAVLIEAKAPGLAGRLLETYGGRASDLISRISPANAVRLGQWAPDLGQLGLAGRFGDLVARFGDGVFSVIERVLQTMERNPKATAIGLTFSAVLAHPEILAEFTSELGKTPGEVAKALIGVFQDAGQEGHGQAADRPFPFKALLLASAATFLASLWLYLRHRRLLAKVGRLDADTRRGRPGSASR